MHELNKQNRPAMPSPGNRDGFAGPRKLILRASNDNKAPLGYLVRKYFLWLAPLAVILTATLIWLLQN